MAYSDIVAAMERVSAFVHRTPVLTCSILDGLVGRSVFLKCENLQKTGSFKARGALNAVSGLLGWLFPPWQPPLSIKLLYSYIGLDLS